jgi:hypothetical protein
MRNPSGTPSVRKVIPAGRIAALAKRAGWLAEKNRKKGYH